MDTHVIRLANMRRLVKEWGGPASFATKLGFWSASYVVQLTGPHPSRPITEKSARRVEQALGLPAGWVDQRQTGRVDKSDVNIELVTQVVYIVSAACADLGVSLKPDKFADAVTIVYQDAVETGKPNTQLAARIVKLAKG